MAAFGSEESKKTDFYWFIKVTFHILSGTPFTDVDRT